jgi:hypothetical protein
MLVLLSGDVEVGELVVLVLHLDVALGEVAVLLLDLPQPLLELVQPALVEAQLLGVGAGRVAARRDVGLRRLLELDDAVAQALVLPQQALGELLPLAEDLEELLAPLEDVFPLLSHPAPFGNRFH